MQKNAKNKDILSIFLFFLFIFFQKKDTEGLKKDVQENKKVVVAKKKSREKASEIFLTLSFYGILLLVIAFTIFSDSHSSLSTRGGDLHGKAKDSKEEDSKKGGKEAGKAKEGKEIVFHKSSRTGGFSFTKNYGLLIAHYGLEKSIRNS